MKCLLLICIAGLMATPTTKPPTITFNVQKRVAAGGGDFKVVNEKQNWDPAKTAIIICDMWDEHWCNGATTRVTELAPHMNKVLGTAREKGMLIVHSPSDCMKYYEAFPQRKIAQQYARPDDKYEEGRTLLPSEKDAGLTYKGLQLGCSFDYTTSSAKTASQIRNTFEISLLYLAEDKSEIIRLIPWY